jgi:hypothetical protein
MQNDALIQQIRSKVAAERAVVAELNAKLSDSYIKKNMLGQATNRLNDAETYLRHGLKSSTPPDFAMWIAAAELTLQIADFTRNHARQRHWSGADGNGSACEG